ncbi:tetratricopeptide repeat protein [Geobacter sp. FeAm09]|uniref:serine protease n=1 Tax=Geobacter sp. FeAm09 TaxID=2597769 RepID=UPI0011EF8766|nr:serine protease [Geobacter sp. FeAm09]QEM67480.1 tetratricopeptide repeat protein [Geobacter sp. FeAm09]
MGTFLALTASIPQSQGKHHMNLLSILAFICFLAAYPPLTSFALTPQEIFRSSEGRVLVLERLDDKGKLLSAHTALLVDNEKAVSQCNLLDGAATLRLRQGDKTFSARPMQKDVARNLCFLQVSGLPISTPPQQRATNPQTGSRVYAIGNTLGLGISISEGVVSGIREAKGDTFIQFTAPIAPGSEGGGLFDEDGRLVGLINYLPRDGQNVNFALPARWIAEIEGRSLSTDAVESWRARTNKLENEKKWQELAEVASRWSEALTDSIEAWLCLAYAREQLKDWPSVEKAYREALKRGPASLQAGIGLAAALLRQNKKQESLDAGRSMLEFRREDGRVWRVIAYAEMALGHFDEAKSAFEDAVRLEPWNRNAYIGLINLAKARNDLNAALAAQRHIVRLAPEEIESWLFLSELYRAAGSNELALNSAEKALEIAPSNGDALIMKGGALYALKRFRDAAEALKSGLGRQPSRPSLGLGWLGDLYYGMGLYPEAIQAYRDALKIIPDDSSLRGRLGVALKDNLEFEEALPLFEQLRKENPKDPFPWRQIGYIHAYQAQPEKAIPAYEQSLGIEAGQAKVWLALMRAYHMAGRKDDVKHAYRKLQALDRSWGERAYKDLLLPYGDTP